MKESKRLDLPTAEPVEREVEGASHGAGTDSVNESTPPAQRTPAMRSKLGDGPRKGAAGEHLPAAYKTRSGFTREDR